MQPQELDWTNPYHSARTPVFGRNVVATSQPLAAQAGLRPLSPPPSLSRWSNLP
jgi:gamma-glutamyltranspeptidase